MKNAFVVVHQDNQSLDVQGYVCFENVVEIEQQGLSFIRLENIKRITVNLKNLVNCDSSGLALLVGWVREAKKNNKPIELIHLPDFLQDILKLFGLDSVLPILWEN